MSAMTAPAHIALTRFFIDQNPITVTLLRSVRTPTGTGGTVAGPATPAGDVEGRLVANQRQRQSQRLTADGGLVLPTHVLIAMPDEDVQLFDSFIIDEVRHEVIGFIDSPPWRINAEVYEHGE